MICIAVSAISYGKSGSWTGVSVKKLPVADPPHRHSRILCLTILYGFSCILKTKPYEKVTFPYTGFKISESIL